MNILKTLIIESLKIAIISFLVLGLIHLINIHQMLGFSILAILTFLGIVLDILLRHGRESMKIKSSSIQETKNIDSMPPNNIDNFKSPLQKSRTIKPQQDNLSLLQEQNDKQLIQNFKISKVMKEKIYFIDGVDKTLDVYENKVVLTDKKIRTALFWVLLIVFTLTTYVIGGIIFWLIWDSTNGKEKTIYIKNIKSIELKKPGTMLNGIMQFNLDDSSNKECTYGSENSIAFSGDSNYDLCCEVVEFIESKL